MGITPRPSSGGFFVPDTTHPVRDRHGRHRAAGSRRRRSRTLSCRPAGRSRSARPHGQRRAVPGVAGLLRGPGIRPAVAGNGRAVRLGAAAPWPISARVATCAASSGSTTGMRVATARPTCGACGMPSATAPIWWRCRRLLLLLRLRPWPGLLLALAAAAAYARRPTRACGRDLPRLSPLQRVAGAAAGARHPRWPVTWPRCWATRRAVAWRAPQLGAGKRCTGVRNSPRFYPR